MPTREVQKMFRSGAITIVVTISSDDPEAVDIAIAAHAAARYLERVGSVSSARTVVR